MASRDLRGLTIEIGGDTSNLTSALRNVDSELSNLQSNLRTVNSALQFDPGNVNALAQRQRLLTDAVAETTQRLDVLREAQRQVDQQIADGADVDQRAYRSLQSEIVRTEASLNGYGNELENVERQLDGTADATDDATDSTSKLNEGWTVMKGVLSELVADGIRKLIDGLKEAASYMLDAGMSFEAGMSQVEAVSGASADDIALLTEKAKEMGATTKFSATEAAEAFNYMAMAGWKAEDMVDGISGVLNLAAASGEDLGTTSDIVTDALTAMGYAAGDAGRLADVMAAASSNANTNVSMMGETFKYAAPLVGAMGYSMEDLAVATGLMANAGIKGEQAGTSLRSIMTRLAAPVKESQEAMDALGISVKDSEGNMLPLSDTIALLREKFNGLSEAEQIEYAKSLAGQEAMSGLLAIVNAAPADFEKLTKAVNNSTGAAETMAKTMEDNLKGDLTSLESAVEGVAIAVYDKFTGALREGVSAVRDFVSGTITMDELFARLGNAVSQAIGVIKGYLPQLGEMGGQLLSNLVQGIVNGIPKLISAAGEMIRSLAGGIKSNMGEFISKGLDLINGLADSLARSLPTLIASGVQMLRNLVKGLMNALPELISRVPEIISKFANLINDNAPTIIAAGFGIIKDLIVGIIQAIPTLIQNIPKIITAIIDVWEAFNWANLGKKAITLLKDGCLAVVNLVKNAGKTVLDGIVNVIKNLPQNLATLGRNAISDLGGAIRGMLNTVKSAATTIFNGIVDAIKNLPSKMLSIGKDIVRGLWNGISDMTGWVIGKIQGFGDRVLSGIKKFFGINSPSKLMKDEVGRYLAEGIGEGIADNNDAALDPMEALKNDLSSLDGVNVSKSIGLNVDASQAEIKRLSVHINELTALVKAYLPEIASKASKNIYIDKKHLVGELASDMDEALGEIANRRAVGAV